MGSRCLLRCRAEVHGRCRASAVDYLTKEVWTAMGSCSKQAIPYSEPPLRVMQGVRAAVRKEQGHWEGEVFPPALCAS